MVRFAAASFVSLSFLPIAALAVHARAVAQNTSTQPVNSLPIRRVTLYKNGVGFFEHAGEVHGNERVTIDFTTAQLNDVLQTLTAVDLGGGRIAGAGYNSTTPVEQQLRSLPLTLGVDPTAADFYSAIRGARVEVTGAGAVMTGRILNVELRQVPLAGKEVVQVPAQRHFLTVVSDGGQVRSVELTGQTGVRLLDPQLHGDVNHYLQILSENHRDGLRHLTLSDNGTGARELRVSYISEVPVWKSTYRILFDDLPKSGPKQATLQGWAVVDNTVGADWNNVQLSLMAGAPQSFIQPISQPYYSRRPEVGLPQEAQLEPQTHESGEQTVVAGLDADRRTVAGVAGMGMGSAGGVMGGLSSGHGNGLGPGTGGNAGGGAYMINGRAGVPAAIGYEDSALASIAPNTTTRGFDDFFEYKMTDPVTILKNQSALVPILQTKVDVDPVTLYSVSDNTALRALWIKNTSSLTLDRGSFSILQNGTFSGQGLLEPIHPGERRLLSYAADTAVRVTPDGRPNQNTRRLQQVSVSKGVLRKKNSEVMETEYLVHNSASESRTIIVEVPRLQGWELDSDPKPEETTASVFRFRVLAAAGETVRLHVGQRHTIRTSYALLSSNEQQIEMLLQQDGDPASVRAALQPVLEAKKRLAGIDFQIAANKEETNRIGDEQGRLRQNLGALRGTRDERDLVKRYTAELNTQEDRLAVLRTQLAELQTKRQTAQEEMAARVEALDVTTDVS